MPVFRFLAFSVGLVVFAALTARQTLAQATQVDATLVPVVYDRRDGSHFTRWMAIDATGRSFDLDTLGPSATALTTLPVGAPLRLTFSRQGARDKIVDVEPRSIPRRTPGGGPQAAEQSAFASMASQWADAPFSGPLPVLVIPCAFTDAGPTSATREAMERAMNDDFPGVGAFFLEASGGRASLAGTRVLDWVTVPDRVTDWFVNRTTSMDRTRFASTLARDEAFIARCLAEARQREPALAVQPYAAIQMMLSVNLGVSYAYLAPVALNSVNPSRRLRLVMNSDWAATNAGVQAHELGHTLGLMHTRGPSGLEYDSRWDVMSNAYSGYDPISRLSYGTLFNGWHRMRLGWGGEDAVVNVSLATMTDTILLTAPARGADARTARVELAPIGPGNARVLTLEARRRGESFETAIPLDGLVLHRIAGPTATVIDRDGNGNPNDSGAVLRPGERWEDNREGLAIEVLDERPGGYRVVVSRRSALQIVATTWRRLQLGRPYQDSLGVLGGVTPVRFTAEALPPGIRLDTVRRVLIGTPTEAGPFTIRLRAIDATGASAAHEITAFVDPLQAAAGPMVREGRVGEPRADTIAYFREGPGFNMPTWMFHNGVPPGMQIDFVMAGDSTRAAILRGTPTQVVNASYDFRLYSYPEARVWFVTFRFRAPRVVVVGDSLRPDKVEGTTGADTLRLGGGGGGTPRASRWRVVSGELPDGWQLDSLTGIAFGVARNPGTYRATVQAIVPSDTAAASLQWNILPALELGEAPWGRALALGAPRLDTLRVLSRAGTPTWRVQGGALPAGITLSADGVLRGAPIAVGAFQALLEVRAGAASRTLALAGLVERLPLRAVWATADTVVVQGDIVLDSIRLLDGDGSSVTFDVITDSLPPGLTFDAERRRLFGRARTSGVWRVPLTATQGAQRIPLTRTWRVEPLAALAADTLPTALAGYDFSHALFPIIRGGGSVTLRPGAAPLPRGLTLSADGRISGIPDSLGSGESRFWLDVARSEGVYEVPVMLRWTIREQSLDAATVLEALLGEATLGSEPARGLDLLGNRNERLDIGDVLRWLVRRGVLSAASSVQQVLPALEALKSQPPSVTPGRSP